MNIDLKPENESGDRSIKEINNLVQGSGRIEQIYLVVDRTVKLAKEIFPGSYCVNCQITCCINDLFLPVTFLEWKTIETYLNNKTDDNTKKQIRENLGKIPGDLFQAIDAGENNLIKYKDKSCPLLIKNKCSIKPYRPVSCRTYGLFLKEGNLSEVNACNPEVERWRKQSDIEKSYLSPINEVKGTLDYLNRNKSSKLLIVWLKGYFFASGSGDK